MSLSAYDSAQSRPDFDDWRDSVRIQIAAADNSPARGDAGATGPKVSVCPLRLDGNGAAPESVPSASGAIITKGAA